MKIEDIIKETMPDVKIKLEKLRSKLLKREASYEVFKKEMLKDPIVKEEYGKPEPEFKQIRKRLKKEDKNELETK